MRLPRGPARVLLMGVIGLLALVLAYWTGYQQGLYASEPDPWAIVIVRRDARKNVTGNSMSWFDRKRPAEARKMRAETARLEAAGVEFYLTRGEYEKSLHASRSPR